MGERDTFQSGTQTEAWWVKEQGPAGAWARTGERGVCGSCGDGSRQAGPGEVASRIRARGSEGTRVSEALFCTPLSLMIVLFSYNPNVTLEITIAAGAIF